MNPPTNSSYAVRFMARATLRALLRQKWALRAPSAPRASAHKLLLLGRETMRAVYRRDCIRKSERDCNRKSERDCAGARFFPSLSAWDTNMLFILITQLVTLFCNTVIASI